MKRFRKIGTIVAVLILISAASVWADDAYEKYSAKKVDVYVNDKKVNAEGLLVDMGTSGRTMLPVRDVATELGAFVDWDSETQTAQLTKPNVDLIFTTVQRGNSGTTQYGLFQTAEVNEPVLPFIIIAQIDSMNDSIHSYRFTMKDPDGEIVYEHEMENDKTEDIMWRTTPTIQMTFDQKGLYTVEFGMKREASDSFLTVAKKSLLSK